MLSLVSPMIYAFTFIFQFPKSCQSKICQRCCEDVNFTYEFCKRCIKNINFYKTYVNYLSSVGVKKGDIYVSLSDVFKHNSLVPATKGYWLDLDRTTKISSQCKSVIKDGCEDEDSRHIEFIKVESENIEFSDYSGHGIKSEYCMLGETERLVIVQEDSKVKASYSRDLPGKSVLFIL